MDIKILTIQLKCFYLVYHNKKCTRHFTGNGVGGYRRATAQNCKETSYSYNTNCNTVGKNALL